MMNFNMKDIKKEELVAFLLNPFERAAYFNGTIVQKYSRNYDVDDIVCISIKQKRALSSGFILYKKQRIVIDKEHWFDEDLVGRAPFLKIREARDVIKETVLSKLEEAKLDKAEEIRSSEKYIKLKEETAKIYFKPMLFSKLGTTYALAETNSFVKETVERLVADLDYDKLALILSGNTAILEKFVVEISESSNFIVAQMIMPEIKEDVEKYVAAGEFTEREKILIDFLGKTSKSGALQFTVRTVWDQTVACKNIVSRDGKLMSIDGYSLFIDIEDIKSVTYDGKKIYQKA